MSTESKFILIISFKSTYDDYCRGCHMETYPEQLYIKQFTNDKVDKIIEYMASLDCSTEYRDYSFDHCVFTEQDFKNGDIRMDHDDGSDLPEGWQELLNKETEKLYTIKKEEETHKHKKEQEQLKVRQEQQERNELTRLTKKYN